MIFIYLALLFTAIYYVVKTLGPEMTKSSFNLSPDDEPDKRVAKLSALLAEKNKNMQVLETKLKISQSELHDFNKVKTLLVEEIHRLREQNRIFRSELGMPTAQSKENSTT